MQPDKTIDPKTPVKKTWGEPKIILISTNQIAVVKGISSVHENTGHYTFFNGTFNVKWFVNNQNSGIAVSSTGQIVGHKSSFIS